MSRLRMVGRGLSVLALVLFLGTACDDPTAVRPKIPETPPVQPPVGMHPEGVYEFTVTGLGTDDIRATATRVDVSSGKISPAAEIRAGLTQVVGLTFESSSSGSFMEGARGQDGYRYVTITYRLRNGAGRELNNVTLIPCITASTIPGTPWVSVKKFDGSSADTALARQIIPTGAVALGQDISLQSLYPDVLQVFTEAETAAIPLPAGVTGVFPYGFMVRNRLNPASRTLPMAANNNDFGGVATFSVRIPLTGGGLATDVFTYTFLVIAYEDDQTRITESVEESMDTAGARRLAERVNALHPTTVTLLAGSPHAAPDSTPYPGQRQICSFRTAGTAAAPVAYNTAPGPYSQVALLWPGESLDPCAPYFRTGTPERPQTGVPFQVRLRAMDRYGNVKTMVTDTVSIQQSPGGPDVTLPSPKPLVAGATSLYVTYNGYGWSILNGVAKRMRGARELSIYGSMRTWNGKAGSNWNTGDNWEGGAVPEEGDTAYIPVSAPNMPQLSDTVSIEAVTVENGAFISMGSYNLKVTMDVVTGTTGGITSTTGTLVLRGTSKFVRGVVPRTSITGTYSLSGDLSAHAPLSVDGGRLADSGYTLTITN